MKDLTLKDVASFHAWATMLINNEDSYSFPQLNMQLDFYEHDDSAYLVLNQYPDKDTTIEYVFISANEDDSARQLIFLFDFLKSVDYSLEKLMDWLEKTPYINSEMGDRIETHGLYIYKHFPQPPKASDHDKNT